MYRRAQQIQKRRGFIDRSDFVAGRELCHDIGIHFFFGCPAGLELCHDIWKMPRYSTPYRITIIMIIDIITIIIIDIITILLIIMMIMMMIIIIITTISSITIAGAIGSGRSREPLQRSPSAHEPCDRL